MRSGLLWNIESLLKYERKVNAEQVDADLVDADQLFVKCERKFDAD